MNVKISINPAFNAGIHWNDEYLINEYALWITMLTNTSDIIEQNIAMERLKYMLHQTFTNAVFINSEDQKQCKSYTNAGLKVVDLPEDPVDQIIGIMLYSKLNAVMQDRINITELMLSSSLGDRVWYTHDHSENLGPFENAGYWKESAPTHCASKYLIRREDRVVKIKNHDAWSVLNLSWPQDKPGGNKDNTVVIYGDFKRDED
jgi:hypothetical protein